MAGIQANTGLATGIDIQGTVDKLIALQAKPRDMATARLKTLKDRQTAVADLTAATIAIQLAAKNLGKTALFDQTTATSSNTALLTTSVLSGQTATPGNYLVTPVRQAQAQQLLSQGFASKSSALGAETITLSQGGMLDTAMSLSDLNGGEGITRGKIRITDRSGTSEVIDLRYVQTVDDVLSAINASESINVRAIAEGDRIRLIDNTGLTTSNLKVTEVSGGTTAASFGLASIDAAGSTAVGNDVVRLYNGLALSQLNDGNGLSFNSSLADLRVHLKDGTSVDIDFLKVAKAADTASATVQSANGIRADLKFIAKSSGETYDNIAIKFVDSGSVTQGNETVVYDASAKTLTFDIDAGATTANDVIAALAGDTTASALFVATRGAGGDGTGLVALSDTATTSGGAAIPAGNEQTIADLLATINAASPSKLKAELSGDGDRIVFTDLTGGGGSFSVESLNDGSLAEDLGLATSTAGSTLSSSKLLGGLNTTLLHSLKGGQGLGTLGDLTLTDRSGATATVDLSSAETIDDVLVAINNAGLGLRAELNSSKNGLKIVDTTGATASNLIIADGDGTNTATKLGLAINAATTEKTGDSLQRQTLSEQTSLDAFNYGKGVALGSFTITDSSGANGAVNLRTSGAETLGDVIEAINALSVGVKARINDTGDGLVLIDTAGGSGKLKVADSTSGTAADLKIVGESVDTTIDGVPAKVIDGSTALKVTLDGDDTLTDLVSKINALDAGINASIFTAGTGSNPYHLSLAGTKTGAGNEWQINGGSLGFAFSELAAAQDALVAVGPSGATGPGLLVSSSTNVVENAVPGVRISVSGTSTDPITVTVKQDVAGISSRAKSFVDAYNKLQEKLKKYDFYQAETNTRGVLYSSSETLQIKSDLSYLISGRFRVDGNLQSLEAVGVEFKDDGTLEFDTTKFENAYADDPAAVEALFTDATSGVGKKIDDAIERLAGIDNSVLITRTIALQSQVEQLSERIDRMSLLLNNSKERMLMQFYRLEESISKIQNSFGAISGTLSNAAALYNNLK